MVARPRTLTSARVSVSDFDELVEHPGAGRAFERAVVPGLGDAAPGGRVRLDALARWLQDVALADVVDARLSEAALWVVRRTRIAVRRFPRFGEDDARAVTWCSGTGRAWAQRRTTIALGGEAAVEAVALWVHLDPESGRPTPFTDAELEVYGPQRERARGPGAAAPRRAAAGAGGDAAVGVPDRRARRRRPHQQRRVLVAAGGRAAARRRASRRRSTSRSSTARRPSPGRTRVLADGAAALDHRARRARSTRRSCSRDRA